MSARVVSPDRTFGFGRVNRKQSQGAVLDIVGDDAR